MSAEFLVISNETAWGRVVTQSLSSYGQADCFELEPGVERAAAQGYVMVVVDADGVVADLHGLITRLVREAPEARVVVATDSSDWRRAREALLAGASDYIERNGDPAYFDARWAQNLAPAEHDAPEASAINDCSTLERTVQVKAKLLFVDNNRDYLLQTVEVLRLAGYHVFAAASVREARDVLEKEHIDMAVVDIRLVEDTNRNDWSGFELAKQISVNIPTIMLTGKPTREAAVRTLKAAVDGHARMTDFIAKEDGNAALIDSIERQLRKRVFIVHGRDNDLKQTVARFIEQLKLQAVILHEQVNMGRSIIEKFEDYSNVGYAIVLLTPDDVGGLDGPIGPSDLKPRARQNVVFELGYFVGKLGRGRVAVLHKGGTEIPSDFNGVLYASITGGDDWKLTLAQNMKRAGLEFELERVFA